MYEDRIETAEEELKRADHLIYVSLKYTRTCDVMKNAIKRMMSAFDLAMLDFLEHKRKNKRIGNVPQTAKERVSLVRNILSSSVKKYLSLYKNLKDIDKAECIAIEEFRKNVTLRTKTPKPKDVKVVDLYNFLEITKEFVAFMKEKRDE